MNILGDKQSLTILPYECTLDGGLVVYHPHTVFLVQVGKHSKGGYNTRYKITGNLPQAVILYNAINIGNGYKKRLIAPSFNKPLLARAWS